jgi:hypothetical protein
MDKHGVCDIPFIVINLELTQRITSALAATAKSRRALSNRWVANWKLCRERGVIQSILHHDRKALLFVSSERR